jgi:hypothetical protein
MKKFKESNHHYIPKTLNAMNRNIQIQNIFYIIKVSKYTQFGKCIQHFYY